MLPRYIRSLRSQGGAKLLCCTSVEITGFWTGVPPTQIPFFMAFYCQVLLHPSVPGWPKYPCSSHPSPWPPIKTHRCSVFFYCLICLSYIHILGALCWLSIVRLYKFSVVLPPELRQVISRILHTRSAQSAGPWCWCLKVKSQKK